MIFNKIIAAKKKKKGDDEEIFEWLPQMKPPRKNEVLFWIGEKFLEKQETNDNELLFRQEMTKKMVRSYFSECDKKWTTDRNPLANNGNECDTRLRSIYLPAEAWSGFGPYHGIGMWREYAQTKCIGAILTPWAMTIALVLAYGRVCLRNFYIMS